MNAVSVSGIAQRETRALARVALSIAVIGLTLLKLWLVQAQHLIASGRAIYDDRLFITLSDHLLNGAWLGPYNNLTLMKGPMYSIWMALNFWIGWPLLFTQHLFYIAACAVFVAAARPVVRGRALRLLLYAALLFNPASFLVTRILRSGIYVPLTLMVVACAAGIAFRLPKRAAGLAPWCLGLGLSLGAFWLTREEGAWILPSAILLIGAGLLAAWRRGTLRARRVVWLLLVPALWAGAVGSVCAINRRAYGVFAIVEMKTPEYKAAYGALTRVTPADFHPYLPVAREVRQRIYAVSPAFAELEPFLEGDIGRRWAALGAGVSGFSADSGEIPGGLFFWAFRDSVSAAGHADAAPETLAYYDRLAREVNAACDDGRLEAGPPHASQLQPLRREHLRLALEALVSSHIPNLFSFYALPDWASTGSDEELVVFEDITWERLSLTGDRRRSTAHLPRQSLQDARRLAALSKWVSLYRALAPFAMGLGLIGLGAVLFLRRPPGLLWTLNLALLGGILARLAMLSLLSATSFPATGVWYMTPAMTLLVPFCVLSIADAALALRDRLRRRPAGAPTDSPQDGPI